MLASSGVSKLTVPELQWGVGGTMVQGGGKVARCCRQQGRKVAWAKAGAQALLLHGRLDAWEAAHNV